VRPSGKHAEIVNVAGLVALIAGAELFRQDFLERKAADFRGRKWKVLKIALRYLRHHCGR